MLVKPVPDPVVIFLHESAKYDFALPEKVSYTKKITIEVSLFFHTRY